jgi:allantoin racemase
VPAGVLPGLLLGGEHGLTVGHAPVINCAAVALKTAEMWVKLRALSGLEPSRGPSFALAPERAKEDFRAFVAAARRKD